MKWDPGGVSECGDKFGCKQTRLDLQNIFVVTVTFLTLKILIILIFLRTLYSLQSGIPVQVSVWDLYFDKMVFSSLVRSDS